MQDVYMCMTCYAHHADGALAHVYECHAVCHAMYKSVYTL